MPLNSLFIQSFIHASIHSFTYGEFTVYTVLAPAGDWEWMRDRMLSLASRGSSLEEGGERGFRVLESFQFSFEHLL